MAEKTETVSFRLPASFSKELRDQAARFDESPGEIARRVVMDALTNRHQQELAELRESVVSSALPCRDSVIQLGLEEHSKLVGLRIVVHGWREM